jgi:hypothetical protein
MGTSSLLTWSGTPDTQGTWGVQQETRDLGSGLAVTTGEPRRAEGTEFQQGIYMVLAQVAYTEIS